MTNLNGWLNLNKEKGITSHDLVNKVRRKLGTKKVGHAGTLDPLATGVMVVAVGKATRLIQFLNETKSYKAELYLGITTTTLDSEGERVEEKEVNTNEDEFLEVIKKYTGKIKQIPPMASAVHHKGVRLYELARKGIEVERESREVEIYSIRLLNFELPKILIEVNCQSGTYIRTLADDIGRDLGCGAYMSGLERIKANDFFEIGNSVDINDLTAENLLPLDFPIGYMFEINLEKAEAARYLNGQIMSFDYSGNTTYARVKTNGELIGIGFLEKNLLTPKVNFVS